MNTYKFLYKVPGDSAVRELQVVSSCFLAAAERFREIIESRHRYFNLVQAYDEEGAPLYKGNLQERMEVKRRKTGSSRINLPRGNLATRQDTHAKTFYKELL